MTSPIAHVVPPTMRVLVADDEPLVLALILGVLRREGIVAQGAHDGESLLRALGSEPGAWDVVLVDARMPGPRLEELVCAMRAGRPDMALVVMSGDIVSARLELGDSTVEWLAKPFRPEQLTEALRRARAREFAA